MKINKILISILAVFQLASCYSDKGNYDYKSVNEVEISGLPKEQIVSFQYSELQANISVKGSLTGEVDNYTYLWMAIPKSGSIDGKDRFELSTDRDLNYFITIPQGDYNVYCFVTDKTTGVEWREKFELKVTSVTRDGWLVLQSEDGRTRLDMISTVGEEEYHLKDLLKESALTYNKNPKRIMMQPDMFTDYNNPGIILVTEDGTTNLDPDTFRWDESMDLKYLFGDNLQTVKMQDARFLSSEGSQYCLTEDYLYPRNVMTSGSIFVVPINKMVGTNDYIKVAPHIGTDFGPYAYGPPIVLYDLKGQRFLQVSPAKNGLIVPSAPEIEFSHITGKDFVTTINTSHGGARTYSILKDSQNKMWLYAYNVSYSFAQVKGFHYMIESPEIENATMFTMHPYLLYMFYVVGNKIYQFDLVTKSNKLVTQSFDGEDITMIKFNLLMAGDYQKPQWYKDIPYRLIVGSTKRGQDETKSGIVRMYNVSTRFDVDLELFNEFDGFSKPVDVTYRERL